MARLAKAAGAGAGVGAGAGADEDDRSRQGGATRASVDELKKRRVEMMLQKAAAIERHNKMAISVKHERVLQEKQVKVERVPPKEIDADDEMRKLRLSSALRQYAIEHVRDEERRSRAQESQALYIHAHCGGTCGGHISHGKPIRDGPEFGEDIDDVGIRSGAGSAYDGDDSDDDLAQNGVETFVKLIRYALVEQFNMIERQNKIIDRQNVLLREHSDVMRALIDKHDLPVTVSAQTVGDGRDSGDSDGAGGGEGDN